MLRNTTRGFTLIELIIVMVILEIMAAVAVPRYLDSIANAEESAEDAVISAIKAGLHQYANNSLYKNGRATWPENPFNALYRYGGFYLQKSCVCNAHSTFAPNIPIQHPLVNPAKCLRRIGRLVLFHHGSDHVSFAFN